MPAKSGKQYRYMQMKAHGGGGMGGPSPETAKKIIEGTGKKKRKKYSNIPPQYRSKHG